jgi:hypothetical protein
MSKGTHSGLGGTSASLLRWYSFARGRILQAAILCPLGKKLSDNCWRRSYAEVSSEGLRRRS